MKLNPLILGPNNYWWSLVPKNVPLSSWKNKKVPYFCRIRNEEVCHGRRRLRETRKMQLYRLFEPQQLQQQLTPAHHWNFVLRNYFQVPINQYFYWRLNDCSLKVSSYTVIQSLYLYKREQIKSQLNTQITWYPSVHTPTDTLVRSWLFSYTPTPKTT